MIRTYRLLILSVFIIFVGGAEAKGLAKDLYAADKELNQAYQALRQSRTPEARKSLLKTQKAWLRKRDRICKLKGLPTKNKAWLQAVAKDKAKTQCVIQLTQDRIARLRANRMSPASVVFTHEAQKKYPPYPEVWGYHFPQPNVNSQFSHFKLHFVPHGDIYLRFKTYLANNWQDKALTCDEKRKYAYIEYFSAKVHRLNCDQYYKFRKRYPKHEGRKWTYMEVSFKSGSRIIKAHSGGGNCYYPLSPYLMKKSPSGKTVFRKTLLYLADVPAIHRTNPSCGVDGGKVVARVIAPKRTRFIDLGDGTFLFYSADDNYVIRFDQNLQSKSPLLGTRLFLVNTDRIDAMRKQSIIDAKENTLKSYQLLHKRVYEYVLTLKQRGRYGD